MKSFAEFWPFYLHEHRRPATRWMHFAGSTLALILVSGAVVQGQPWLLLGAIVSGYGFAWVSHFGIEKNKPATFQHPLWSLIADWKMWSMMITGRLEAELTRLGIGRT